MATASIDHAQIYAPRISDDGAILFGAGYDIASMTPRRSWVNIEGQAHPASAAEVRRAERRKRAWPSSASSSGDTALSLPASTPVVASAGDHAAMAPVLATPGGTGTTLARLLAFRSQRSASLRLASPPLARRLEPSNYLGGFALGVLRRVRSRQQMHPQKAQSALPVMFRAGEQNGSALVNPRSGDGTQASVCDLSARSRSCFIGMRGALKTIVRHRRPVGVRRVFAAHRPDWQRSVTLRT